MNRRGNNWRRGRDHGQVVYLDSAATGAGDGSTWADAYTDGPTAIAALTGAKTELRIAGAATTGKTYKPDGADPGNRALYFSPPDGCDILGGFVGGEVRRASANPWTILTILSGDIGASAADRSYHVLGWLADADCLIDGVQIEKGQADSVVPGAGGGGAFGTYGSGMIFSNCLITDCYALGGGAGAVVDSRTPMARTRSAIRSPMG